ncbi:MAG: hypothetical protein UV60_C0018G0001, partial [Parcubacteria group bacterium GW2011_GWA2_43_11]
VLVGVRLNGKDQNWELKEVLSQDGIKDSQGLLQ